MSVEHQKEIQTPNIILPKEVQALPLVCQEGVRDVLAFLEQMREEEKWFRVRTPEELNQIIPQIQSLAQEFMDNLRPFKKEDHSWDVTWDAVRVADRVVTRVAARVAAQVATRAVVRIANRVVTWDAVRVAARAGAWEAIKDQLGFENPFFSLVKLYALGMVKWDFEKVNGKEQLVIDFPLKVEGKPLLGCLVFGEGEQGDQEVLFFHQWGKPHSEIKPLNPRIIG